MKRIIVLLFTFLIMSNYIFAEGNAEMDSYPEKDITLIVPWSAGGGTDTIARALVKNSKAHFGVNVNVVNKTGAQGLVGMGATSTAAPDGYTIGLITFGLSTYNLMGLADLTYRDFELIQLLNQSASVLYVKADSQWQTLKQLSEYAKANPYAVALGHTGAGGDKHLSAASFATAYGIDFDYVPYDGSAPLRDALSDGYVDVAVAGVSEILELNKTGQIKILAINNTERHASLPNVPTVAEAGYKVSAPVLDWRGIALPKGVPEQKAAVIEAGFKELFDDPEFVEFCDSVGLTLVYEDSDGFEDFLSNMEKVLEPTLEAVSLTN